jgi:hypothetical protein
MMGWIGLVIIIVLVSFGAVTLMGWDNYFELLQTIADKFGEFVGSGVEEAQDRI